MDPNTETTVEDEGAALAGVFLEARPVRVQCVDCGTVLEVDLENPSPEDLASAEPYKVPCETCSKRLGEPCHVEVLILAGAQIDMYELDVAAELVELLKSEGYTAAADFLDAKLAATYEAQE